MTTLGQRRGTYLFRVVTFHPTNRFDYMRVRDEGFRTTMTIKKDPSPDEKYDREWEITVSDYETAIQMCELMGMRRKYYVEKIREIWNVGNSEVIFDWYPGLPPIIEIESPIEVEMKALAAELGLVEEEQTGATAVYWRLYGVTTERNRGNLRFDNAHETFGPYIKFGRAEFDRELDQQRKKIQMILARNSD